MSERLFWSRRDQSSHQRRDHHRRRRGHVPRLVVRVVEQYREVVALEDEEQRARADELGVQHERDEVSPARPERGFADVFVREQRPPARVLAVAGPAARRVAGVHLHQVVLVAAGAHPSRGRDRAAGAEVALEPGDVDDWERARGLALDERLRVEGPYEATDVGVELKGVRSG
eukprot:1383-Pelagococcus_subviridis.AAC.1